MHADDLLGHSLRARAVRVSLGLPTHRVDAAQEFVSGDAVAEIARQAEAAGFAAVFVTDHPAPPADWIAAGGHHTVDPFVTLSFAAASTTTLHLQTNLFVPAYRHPLLSAKLVASLDAMSRGRVILGVGAGYLQGEFEALGADFDNRNDVLDHAIRTMRAAWTGDPTDGVLSLPSPAQAGGPPVWIGGNSTRARARAARFDGWFADTSTAEQMSVRPDELAELAARLPVGDGFDVIVHGYSDQVDPRAYEAVGTTWWLEDIHDRRGPFDELLRLVEAGPPVN